MNILLNGYFDRNFGDDLMIRLVARQLKEHNFFINITKKELLIPFSEDSNIHTFDNSQKIDVILRVTGSGFIVRSKRGLLELILEIPRIITDKKTKKAVIGCNIGPYINNLAQKISSLDLRTYALVTTRELQSYEYMKKIASKKQKIYNFHDIVYSLPDEWITPKTDEKCLGISAYRRQSNGNYEFYSNMAKIADDYIEKNSRKVLLFAFDIEFENDLCAAHTILSLCKNKEMIEIIAHDDNGNNIIRNFNRCEKIVSVRFHSAVLALRLNIPLIPIIYSAKTENMLNDIGYNGDKFYIDDLNIYEIEKKVNSEVLPFQLSNQVINSAKMHSKVFMEAFNEG